MKQSRSKAVLTDAQREIQVKSALKRFVRNKNLPEDQETLRYNLIVARVNMGLTAVEAAPRFGYANSTQISLIESGERPIPSDRNFLVQAAKAYSVSTDFLVGLSPHMEFDAKVSQQYALMRGTEDILGGLAAGFATVMIQYTNQTQPMAEDYQRICDAVTRVSDALKVMREKYAFDDIRGSAPLMKAIEGTEQSIAPLREKLRRFKGIDSYFADLKQGKIEAIPYLVERYTQRDLNLEG